MRNNFTRHFLNYFVAADFRTSAETVFAPLMRTGTQPRTVRTDARRKVAVLLGVRRADADAGGRTLRGIDGVSSVGGLESERSPAPVPNPVPLGASCRRKRWGIQRGAFGGRWRQDLHANVVLRGTVDEKVRPEASLRIV